MRSGIGVLIAGALAVVALALPSPVAASTAGDPIEAEFNYAGFNLDLTLYQLDQLFVDGTGEPVTLNGTYDDDAGNFTLPEDGGLEFPDATLDANGETASFSFALSGDATGHYDSDTGKMSLEAPLSLTFSISNTIALGIPDLESGSLSCRLSPLVANFSTDGGWPHAGAAFEEPEVFEDGALAGYWQRNPPAVALEGSQDACNLIAGIMKSVGGLWLAHSSTPLVTMPPPEDPKGPPCQLATSIHYLSCCPVDGETKSCWEVFPPTGGGEDKLVRIGLNPWKLALRPGKSRILKLSVRNLGSKSQDVDVSLSSSNPAVKLRNSISVTVPAQSSLVRRVTVQAGKNARGRAVITAKANGRTTRSIVPIKPLRAGSAKNRRSAHSR